MKLITTCNHCKSKIKVKSFAPTRPALEMHKGEKFKVECKECGRPQQKVANDVRAIPSKIISIGGVLISLVVTVLLWEMLGAIGTVTFFIPFVINKNETNAVRAFNSYQT